MPFTEETLARAIKTRQDRFNAYPPTETLETQTGTWLLDKDHPPGVGWRLTPPQATKGMAIVDQHGSKVQAVRFYSSPEQCRLIAQGCAYVSSKDAR